MMDIPSREKQNGIVSAPRQGRPVQWWLGVLTVMNLLLLAGLFIAEFVIAERRWWATFLTYMPQCFVLVPPSILCLLALLGRRWSLVGWNVLAVAVCLVLFIGINIPMRRGTWSGSAVRLLTLNVHRAEGDMERLKQFVTREAPDILYMQEVNELGTQLLSPRLRTALPGWHCVSAGDVAIFSRTPILESRAHPVLKTGRVILETAVDIHGTRLTIINVHMNTSLTAESLSSPQSSVPAYLRDTAYARAVQFRMLQDIAVRSPYPVCIAGDFNTPPRGVLYRHITRQYTDAFHAAGWGSGDTYPATFPILRIDHFFIDKRLSVRRCYRTNSHASDHYGMVADIVL